MPSRVNLIIDKIDLGLIKVVLNPSVAGLKKEELDIQLNGENYQNYNILDDSDGKGEAYSMRTNTDFNPRDILDIQIIKEGFESDKVKIAFAKTFYESNSELDFKLSANSEGNYKIILMKVNNREFNISSDEIVVSRPIDAVKSYVDFDQSRVYFLNDIINCESIVFTIDGTKVPDGKYIIKIELCK